MADADEIRAARRATGWFDDDARLWTIVGPRGRGCLRQEELLAHLPPADRTRALLDMRDADLLRELPGLDAPLCDLTTGQLRVLLRCWEAGALTGARLERLLVRYGYTFKFLCGRGPAPEAQYVAVYDERKALINVVCLGTEGRIPGPRAAYAFTVPFLEQQ